MNEPRKRRGSLGVGLVLMSVGFLLLLGELGFIPLNKVWQFWPFLLIGLGFAKIVAPADDREERWGAFWLVFIGLYCLVSSWRLFGLYWGNSWPLLPIAGGLMMIVRTLAEQNRPRRLDGDRHE